jgi:proteasome accessory factor A
MAIAKVCGVETEYGIVVRGADLTPMAASSLLINAYLATLGRRTGWDFLDEQPGNDARGFTLDDALAPEVDTGMVNAVLTNGARYYVDHAHPEISTPECRDAFEVVRFDRAAEEIVRASMVAADGVLGSGAQVLVHKNNSDGKGNSYGCHENYLVARETPFGRLVAQITPHFISRQIFCGAGKVGCELPGVPSSSVPFQISQRADFFEEEVGLETTLRRPIVNTRDEPHCDPVKYRRLHVIVGDANMSQVATYLKVGTTAIVLAMIEDDALSADWVVAHPVRAMRDVSHDPTLRATMALRSGRQVRALDIQWELYQRARQYQDRHGLDCVGADVGADVLERWERVLEGLESEPASVAHWVDWVAKQRLVAGYANRHGLAPGDMALRALDLQYHDMRPQRCLADRMGFETLVDAASATRAMSEPPETTRAYFRGRCLEKWPDAVVAANWDSMVFDVGAGPLRRVPMMEPLRGTAALVGKVIEQADSAEQLLARLGS